MLLASDDKPHEEHAHAPPLSCNTYQRGRSKTLRGGGLQKKKAKQKKRSLQQPSFHGRKRNALLRFQPCKIRIRIVYNCPRRMRERGMCHPIVPETRWKAWIGREESAPPVAMPSSRCDVLDVAGRSGDCLHFSVLPSLCHAAGAWLPAYPPPAPRVWRAVEAMRKEPTWNPHATPSTTTCQPAMRPKQSAGCSHRLSTSPQREHLAALEAIQTGHAPAAR